MLRKSHILKTNETEGVFVGSNSGVSGKNLTLVYKNKNEDRTRVAFSISSKVVPSAVNRNTIKRRARAIIKNNINKIKKTTNIVFIFKRDFSSEKISVMEKEMIESLRKAKLIIS